jgi:hypothetical protein
MFLKKKFWSGHRVSVNIVHKHCSETSFANNIQSVLFANIVRRGLHQALDSPLFCVHLFLLYGYCFPAV